MTPRNEPAALTVGSTSSLDEAANCVVAALDSAFVGKLGGEALTNRIEITKVSEVYEIRPQQTLSPAGEMYFVRLTKETSTTTKIEAFRLPAWAKEVDPAVQRCSGVR